MKTDYGKILVLAMVTIVLLAAALPCVAAEKDEENICREGELKRQHRRFELTDVRIKHTMSQLAETDPEKAKELEKLREKEPGKFKAEIRKVMRERFSKRVGEQSGKIMKYGRRGSPAMHGGEPRRAQRSGTRRRERHAEYLKWLEKNYPEEAKKLAELREEKPGLHTRRLALAYRKYRRIMEAEKESPELAKVLKEDLEVKQKRDKLLRKIRAASDDDEKKELIEQLEKVVSSRFDLIVRRKQIEYEQLLKKLERLKERVKKSEANVEKWKGAKFKSKNIKARLEELVNRTENFKWD